MKPFSYELPSSRIAQRPASPRHSAKLLVVNRKGRTLSAHSYWDLPAILAARQKRHTLVFNNTKVIPARLFGHALTGEGGRSAVEILLLRETSGPEQQHPTWLVLGRPMKRLKPGVMLHFDFSKTRRLFATVIEKTSAETATVRFESRHSNCGENTRDLLFEAGSMPIPPYIRKGRGDERDLADYQTMFARHPGSIAAPTASLHFTPELMEALRRTGCFTLEVTLHVGQASIRPVSREDGCAQQPGPEQFVYDPRIVRTLMDEKGQGGEIIAVGTTSVRALESMARGIGKSFVAGSQTDSEHSAASGPASQAETELFIVPGFEFLAVDGLITNFHQPGSSHLLLVEAFLGRALLAEAYAFALQHEFRFLSYGDGMLIT